MAPVPTVSRIFADRYRREATRLEKLHAHHLAPGTATWGEAMVAMEARLEKLPGPIKKTACVRNAAAYLRSHQKDSMHFMLGFYCTKRSSGLSFGTINFGTHPLAGISEDGVSIMRHTVLCRRDGSGGTKANLSLGYISRHAVQRLHERGGGLSIETATNMFGCIGMLGCLLHHSKEHVDGAMSLRVHDLLATGVVRFAVGEDGGSCTFFEVRTFLPADDMDNRPEMLRQGEIAMTTLQEWVETNRDSETSVKLLAKIPTRHWREEDDYILQTAVKTKVGA